MPPAVSPEEFDAYFRLLWLFAFIMFCLMALLCYLYLSMRRAGEREAQSRTFSWLLVAAQEEERRRISCELHDTVLPEIRRLRQEMLADRIREICFDLMPPDFTRLSLRDSLTGLCLAFAKRTGIECVPALEEGLDFNGKSPEEQLHLYRMAQEALTNIEKHAGASRVVLVARRHKPPGSGAPGILICVSDDGRGFREGDEESGAGLGLRSMRERAAILGARLDFISESGNGLMVRIEIPLNRPGGAKK